MSQIRRVPFTELVERVQGEVVRDIAGNASADSKYRGMINDVYLTDFQTLLPEDLLRKQGNITTIADYSTGTITVAAAGATITGEDTAWTSAISNNAMFQAGGEDGAYRVTYTAATTLTLLDPTAWTDDAVTDGTYKLMFDRYALASDFGHMVEDDVEDPEAVYWNSNASRQFLTPKDNGEYDRDFQLIEGTPAHYTVKWVTEDPYLYIWPCDTLARSMFYFYIPNLLPLQEKTGTATSAGATTAISAVSGLSAETWLNSTEDFYFRFDADGTGEKSRWHKIASYTDTTITLAANYPTARTTAAYTLSSVSRYPSKYDRALIYGAALRVDPDAKDAQRWAAIYGGMIPAYKRLYGTRIHGQSGSYNRKGYK